MNPIVLIIGIAIVVLILIIATISIRGQRSGVIEERLGRYTEVGSFMTLAEEDKPKEKKPSALVERLEGILSQRSFGAKWRGQLARADLRLTVTEFLFLHVISMFGIAIVTFFILSPGNIVMTIILSRIGLFLPRFYVSYKQGQRLHRFEEQLPDILGLWVNALRSGYSVLQ